MVSGRTQEKNIAVYIIDYAHFDLIMSDFFPKKCKLGNSINS